jgi:glutathione peroxidase
MLKFASSIALAGAFAMSQAVFANDQAAAKSAEKTPAALNFKVQSLDDKEVDLSQYKGKVVLIVNVASKCGLTPQYKALEALYEKDKDKGLVILGFPCNQFHQQEPGTASEIRQFCTAKYNVTFPMMAKVEVNGASTCDLYKYLKALDAKPKGAGDIKWNFEKFVVGRNGEVVGRFEPKTTPDAPEVTALIESELAK